MRDFLVANQAIAAPLIEWGGTVLLLALVLSPFLLILHRAFRPTRWWHAAGAYVASFLIFLGVWSLISLIDQWLIRNFLNTIELYTAYNDGIFRASILLLPAWLLLIFYCAKLMYHKFTRFRFWASLGVAFIFAILMIIAAAYTVAYFIGQASMNF